jgi:hypothetical protein
MKYTFVMEETNLQGQINGNKVISEFQADMLSDILEKFQDFLKGSGFIIDGYLDVVNDNFDEEEWHTEEFETPVGDFSLIVDSMMNPPKFRAADLTGKNA